MFSSQHQEDIVLNNANIDLKNIFCISCNFALFQALVVNLKPFLTDVVLIFILTTVASAITQHLNFANLKIDKYEVPCSGRYRMDRKIYWC